MSFYQRITPVQSIPFDGGQTKTPTPRWSRKCNYEVTTGPGVPSQFEEEIAKIISDAGYGTLGTDMWWGSDVRIPEGDGPFIILGNTSGSPPQQTHGSPGDIYPELTFQVAVYSTSYSTCRTRAINIHNELNLFNKTKTAA